MGQAVRPYSVRARGARVGAGAVRRQFSGGLVRCTTVGYHGCLIDTLVTADLLGMKPLMQKMDLMIVDLQKQKTGDWKIKQILTQFEIKESILRDIKTIGNGSTHTHVYDTIQKN